LADLKVCTTRRCGRRSALYVPLRHATKAVALLLLAASIACGSKSGGEETVEPPEVPTIAADVGKVTRRPMVDDLVVRGTITAVPNEDVKVSALVAGRVNAVTVAEGDTVTQGQVIAELDRQPLLDQRRQAAAAVEQARAQLENARLNLQRNQQLFERGIAAGKEVEDARTQLAAAQAALEQAQAALSTADRNIERAVVRSPIAGQVVKRMVSVGEQVDGTSAQPIAQIANTDRVELAANVPSEYLPRIMVGQVATLSTDAPEPRAFTGRVLAIAPAVDPTTNAGLVRIRITNAGRALKIGMFAEAHVTLEQHDALVVPPPALVRTSEAAYVWVVNGDVAQRTVVKTGIEKPDAVEIVSGVTEGQAILISSVYGLGEKAKLAKPAAAAGKPETP
jgi:membrane fusion protein (multidrug efflux system)